jgi:ferredoxin
VGCFKGLELPSPQQATEISYNCKKRCYCKSCVIRELRESFKKGLNYTIKKLAYVNKGATFAPATAIDVH